MAFGHISSSKGQLEASNAAQHACSGILFHIVPLPNTDNVKYILGYKYNNTLLTWGVILVLPLTVLLHTLKY